SRLPSVVTTRGTRRVTESPNTESHDLGSPACQASMMYFSGASKAAREKALVFCATAPFWCSWPSPSGLHAFQKRLAVGSATGAGTASRTAANSVAPVGITPVTSQVRARWNNWPKGQPRRRSSSRSSARTKANSFEEHHGRDRVLAGGFASEDQHLAVAEEG